MANVLLLASETIGGAPLIEAVKERAAQGDATFFAVVPQTRPRHGNVIYDDAVRDAAQVRVDLVTAFMASEGIRGTGEVGDPDPFTAAMDAIEEHKIDEVIISTRPAASSGWLTERRSSTHRAQPSAPPGATAAGPCARSRTATPVRAGRVARPAAIPAPPPPGACRRASCPAPRPARVSPAPA